MEAVLRDLVIERLLDDKKLSSSVADLIDAACESQDAFDAQLGTNAPVRPALRGTGEPDEMPGEPGIYLGRLRVRGMRGIGKEVELPLVPGPGLTVVVGRNGSGKSSLAEAAEALIRGDRPEEGRDLVWKASWRNLHETTDCVVGADLYVEGKNGRVELSRRWSSDQIAKGVPSARSVDFDGELSPDSLQSSCAKHSPFLAHTAVASLLAKPSTMHDAFVRVLDLDDLTVVQTRITEARKHFEQSGKTFASSTASLRSTLSSSDDERAAAAIGALASEPPDLDRLQALVVGAEQPGGQSVGLRQLVSLPAPNVEAALDAVGKLVEARDALTLESSSDITSLESLADLLDRAVKFRNGGNATCPVCQTEDVLDAEWDVSAAAQVVELRERTGRLSAARKEAEAATRTLANAMSVLLPDLPVVDPTGVDLGPLRTAAAKVDELRSQPTDLGRVRAELSVVGSELIEAYTQTISAAKQELAASDDVWKAVATRLAAWCGAAREGAHAKALLSELKKAESWMKDVVDDVRNERFKPIASEAERLWQMMRTASNVGLKTITLGRRTQGLDLSAGADGADATAMAVMSQGELNTLVLSLFLPRATLASSPFRFVMIDDPVQAMDPSKVEGLALVLHDLGTKRQVVVFSHDERLPAAIDALSLPATVIRLYRDSDSVVSVADVSNPSDRFVNDAGAVCADDQIPEEIKRSVATALCRDAVEAAASRAYRRISARKRRAIADVEGTIAAAEGPYGKLSLALFDEPGRSSAVLARLNNDKAKYGSDAPAAVKALKEVHASASTSLAPGALVASTRALCKGLDAL